MSTGLRVLIVNDERFITTIVKKIVEELGCEEPQP